MVDFLYTPPTYYAPGQYGTALPPNSVQNLASAAAVGVVDGINAALYDPSPFVQTPGSVGYRLPAQNYVNYGPGIVAQFGTPSLKTALINSLSYSNSKTFEL